uniref:Uncharacterized protein n=1 Tax=Arion vulgaris TaxID=1028688 RepID=A0A0B7B987_9EUPU
MKTVFMLLWFVSTVCTNLLPDKKNIVVPEYITDRLFQLVLEGQILSDSPGVDSQVNFRSNGNYQNVQILQHVCTHSRTTQKWQIFKNVPTANMPILLTIALLDAYFYGRALKPSDVQLISTIEFCKNFRSIYKPYINSLIMSAPCVFREGLPTCFPVSTASLDFKKLDNSTPSQKVDSHKIVEKSLIGKIINVLNNNGLSKTKYTLKENLFLELHHNPNDSIGSVSNSDDTFLWLGFGSVLESLGKEFPLVRDTWLSYNLNISSAFDALKKYAYRPFSPYPLVNTIDSASYYYLRDFLDDAKFTGKDVALATVWFANVEDNITLVRGNFHHTLLNDIDLVTSANIVYGITNLISSGLVGPEILQDKEISQIYQNTSAMIAYLINSNFTNRPDLSLHLYPSRYLCYFAVARIVSTLDIYQRKGDLPEEMKLIFSNLKQAMEGEATRFLIADVKRDEDASQYFQDFLGNGELTKDNKPIYRAEDRIFTTAMAANALMYTWLSFDTLSRKSHWKTGTPKSVKNIVNGCVLWLVKNTLEGKFKPWNALATTQNKGRDTMAFLYPSNHFIEIPQLQIQFIANVRLIAGVQGYIPKNEYEDMLNKNQFGKPTPIVFKGYNHPDFGDKLILSSDPYTYTITLLALSRYQEITVLN